MTGAEVMVGAAIVSSLASVGTAIYTMSKSSPGSPDLAQAQAQAQADPTLAQADAQRAEDIAAQERARRAAAGRASTMLMGGAADDQTLGGGGQPAAQAPTATKVLLGG